MRKVGAVQSSKWQKLTNFLPKLSLDFPRTVSTSSLLEGHESPALNLASKSPGLALTPRVSRATKMTTVWQGVSEYRSYSLWQMSSLASYNKIVQPVANEIIGFVQQNSEQLLVSNMDYHSLDQEVRHIRSYSYQYLFLWVDTELFKTTDHSSTSNYSALLCFSKNFVILLVIILAMLMNI